MPQHKSAKKRVRQNLKKRQHNLISLSKFRTSLRELEKSIAKKDQSEFIKLLSKVDSLGARAANRGIIKKRKSSRKISKLSKSFRPSS